MSSVDWESKFNAIFRDTVHNLDRVKDRLDSTKAGLVGAVSNSDFGLRSESVKDTSHSSHTAVMRDLLSSNGAPGGNDVNYPLLDNSPSIINLLSDKLDSQSKMIEELTRRLEKSDEAREACLHEVQSLRDEMTRLRGRVVDRSADVNIEQKLTSLQHQCSIDIQSMQSQLLSLHSRLDEILTKNSASSSAFLELQRFTNSEVDLLHREIQSLKNKLETVETDVANLSLQHKTMDQHKNSCSQARVMHIPAWDSLASSGPANKDKAATGGIIFLDEPTSEANAATDVAFTSPDYSAAQLRYWDLQKKLSELESEFMATNIQFTPVAGRRLRRKKSSVHRPSSESYDRRTYNNTGSEVDISTATDTMTMQFATSQAGQNATAISSDEQLQTTDALSDLSTDTDESSSSLDQL